MATGRAGAGAAGGSTGFFGALATAVGAGVLLAVGAARGADAATGAGDETTLGVALFGLADTPVASPLILS